MREHRVTTSRTARYYTLGVEAAVDVWFVLHGYGQLAARFLTSFASLDDGRRLLVAPEALSRFYLDPEGREKVGASWMTREDRLAEIDDYVRYLDAVAGEVLGDTAHAGRRVTVLGFSQGAATACRWAALGSTRVDRLIVWGGEVPPDLDLAHLRAVPLSLVHGGRDEMITPKVVAGLAQRLTEAGVTYRVVSFDGGHELNDEGLIAISRTP